MITCAKVVADLDFLGELRVAEEALDLALGGSVALLHFGGVVQSVVVVLLGRTGGATDAIATGAATNQKDHVPW